jgi:hypothetical protein
MVYCFEVFGNISSVVGGRDIWYVPVEIYYKQPSVSEAYHNEQFFFNGKLLVLIFRTWVLFVEGLQKKKVEHVSSQTAHIQYL